jgi:hypothetical protein
MGNNYETTALARAVVIAVFVIFILLIIFVSKFFPESLPGSGGFDADVRESDVCCCENGFVVEQISFGQCPAECSP